MHVTNKNPQNTIKLPVVLVRNSTNILPYVHKEYCEVEFNSSCCKNYLHKIPKLKSMPTLKKRSLPLHKSSGEEKPSAVVDHSVLHARLK